MQTAFLVLLARFLALISSDMSTQHHSNGVRYGDLGLWLIDFESDPTLTEHVLRSSKNWIR